jgi:hypothetical protein
MQKANFVFGFLALGMLVAACGPNPSEYIPPTPNPYISPTPTPTPFGVPTPQVTSTPNNLGSFQLTELANGDLVSDSFKLQFGPGSKGIKLDFGPGTKGPRTEFGPGTKGPKNLEFNVQLPAVLVSSEIQPFSVQQAALGGSLFLNQLQVEFIRENQVYATASILPRRPSLEVPAQFHPGTYSIQVVAQTAKGPLTMSWSRLQILPEYKAELKIEVFADPNTALKPEDLDVEILSQNRSEKLVFPDEPQASASAEVSPVPGTDF